MITIIVVFSRLLAFSGEWVKFWFVLRANTLTAYRNHAAEDAADVEDTLDLGQVVSVDETDSGRSYGFQLTGFDGKKCSLAALTSGIRSHWVHVLRNSCNQGISQLMQWERRITSLIQVMAVQ